MPEPLYAKTSTTLDALEHTVDTHTSVAHAEAIIPTVHAPTEGHALGHSHGLRYDHSCSNGN